ncbi:MAG: hypothetical protein A2Y15_01265 [Clostridiales bacterium GWF2_36_10]|nr:MAG: hypothetical protein A2Y15_01265 [Clostridiales bacterium GWF2_36_10]
MFIQEGSAENDFSKQVGQVSYNITEKADLSVTAVRSVLIEANSGSILYGNKEFEQAGMASTTKIMTALVVINTIPLDNVVAVPKEAVGVEGSSLYLTVGERLTVKELLYGLLLESGNDCAVALAVITSGNVKAFVEKMNQKAAEMGLKDTHFTNPHGLSDQNHYTSAYSLALITAEALKNETFKQIVSTKQTFISRGGEPNLRCLTNHNRLLFSYSGMIGVKTGYTIATGRCLVTAAERDGVILIAVTLNDRNDWASHRNMLDYGYSKYESVTLAEEGKIRVTVPVTGGLTSLVNATNNEGAVAFLEKGSAFNCKIITPHFLYAPVKIGDTVGYAEYYNTDGELFYRLPLIATENVEIKRLSFLEKLFSD